MGELIEQIASKTGVDPTVAQRAVSIILKFLAQEGPDAKVQPLIDAIPGAQEAVSNAPYISGGVMGAFKALTSAGLGIGEVQGVTEQFIAFANEKVGEGTVREVVESIPGLNQFV